MISPRTSEASAGLVRKIRGAPEIGILTVLVVLVVAITLVKPGFVSGDSINNIVTQAAWFGIMSLGMVFLLSMGDVDLSVGSNYALSIVTAAVLMRAGLDPWLGCLVGVAIGAGLGAVNGILANSLQIPTIIVTLGTLSVYRGLALVVAEGRVVGGLPREHPFFTILGGSILGIPTTIWTYAILAVAMTLLYRSTRFGFLVRAIGSNRDAAVLSGMRVGRVRMAALILTGALCGIAGMLTLAFFQSAHPSLGLGVELLVIASAIIGGTALTGGSGSVPGAVIGALLISVIRSGLVQVGITANWSQVATGAMIIAAVALDALLRRRRDAGSR
jgi:ribose transport system permease protein